MKQKCMEKQFISLLARYQLLGLICTLYISTAAFAADRKHELITLLAAKDVEFHSQKIAKAYFYQQQDVRPNQSAEDLKQSLVLLQKGLVIILEGIEKGDKEEKNIAIFLEDTMDELKDIVGKAYSKKNGMLTIDYSESLLEGGEFIATRHRHKQNDEETMLVAVKDLLVLLERINKFYIAYQAGFKDNVIIQLKQAVEDLESTLTKINAYTNYAGETLTSRNKLNEFWPVAKEFFVDIQKGALPVIVLASVDKLEKELKVLEDFHHNKVSGDK
ncbi:MAG: hypothetical protein D3910_05050 [Candidatus Electrothrix sp. ATG2]|nr:hypothetical protein [Candidatus Electrothrix sp. ATG2]